MGRRRKSIYKLPKLKLKPKTVVTVATLVAFIFAGLSLVAIMSHDGKIGFWRDTLTENFGWTMVLSPIFFLLVGLVLQKVKWKYFQMNTLVGLVTFAVALMGLFAALEETKGGALGDFIWGNLSNFITPPGAVFLLLAIFLVGLAVMLDMSFHQVAGLLTGFSGVLGKLSGLFNLFHREESFPARTAPLKVSGIENYTPPLPRQIKPAPATPNKAESPTSETLVQNVAGQGRVWKYPPYSLLTDKGGHPADRGDIKKSASTIERTLESFGIEARVAEINGGPAVTQYALEISTGTKIAKIANLQNDIALALATRTGTVRIEAPIPGKSLVGIEVPNHSLELVTLKSVITSDKMTKEKGRLAVALGKDTASTPVAVDLAKMPHVLVAGTTGSGKSSLINSSICSLIFRNSPDQVKMILIDPKRVELSAYRDIPHLLTPVIVEPEKILSALKWAVAEMDRRYRQFQQVGVRNIQGYNEMSGFQALPYIVIFIDELADLMMFAPVEVEDAITRIAQLARAVGIHLMVATQRPSVDVITGLIKANIPCRIAFNVASLVDSRTILDQPGAEKLLGRGDMLFLPPDAAKPIRVQGVYVSDPEIQAIADYVRSSGIEPQYIKEVTEMPIGKISGRGGGGMGDDGDQDDLFEEAVRTVCQYDRASASLLQRRLRIGYARAARILDELESAGVVGPGDGAKPRDVLVRNAEEYFNQGAQEQPPM